MFYIGLDLAWGLNEQTGVAVADADGNLIFVAAARTNQQIERLVRPYIDGACLVAIDAPLVVVNPSGPRPCETEVTQIFGSFHAGAHSSSLKRAEFRPRPRGAVLADELGLDIDPASSNDRRAIEVFPHPAIVALFRLPRIIKFKDTTRKGKKPRTLSELQPELERLMSLIEHQLCEREIALHVNENPDWQRLRTDVRLAPSKAALGRAGDEVDAVVCAYIARYADLNPAGVVTYGDIQHGYIVTPRLPPELMAGEPDSAIRGNSLPPASPDYTTDIGCLIAACRDELSMLERALSPAAELPRAGATALAEAVRAIRRARDRIGVSNP